MFPDDGVAMKVVGLAVMDASGKWTMPSVPEPEVCPEPLLYRIRRKGFFLFLINVLGFWYRLGASSQFLCAGS